MNKSEPTILVIDDEYINRLATKQTLRKVHGEGCDLAVDGE